MPEDLKGDNGVTKETYGKSRSCSKLFFTSENNTFFLYFSSENIAFSNMHIISSIFICISLTGIK